MWYSKSITAKPELQMRISAWSVAHVPETALPFIDGSRGSGLRRCHHSRKA
jgi:hypothetical protein